MRESFFAACGAYLEQLRRADSFDSISKLWRETNIPYTMQATDPHSQAYRDEVLAVYAGLTQGRYDLNNELTSTHQTAADFEIGYPWISRNLDVVSQELVKTVQALRALHRGASGVQEIIEFGCGWGNLAVPLVKAGQRVTVIDIDENFLHRVRTMVEREGLAIETVHADFVEGAGRVGRRFDVAVFQSSFHHCLEFEELLRRLRDQVLKDDGRILFVSEPVMPNLPFPWGLRYDGESLWAIMCNKWLELGFDEQFFLQLLHRHGFFLSRVDEIPGMVGPGWQATRMAAGMPFADWVLPSRHEAGFWAAAPEKAYGRFLRESARLPALPAVAQAYHLELHNYGPRPLRLKLRSGQGGWDSARLDSNERRTIVAPAAAGAELELQCETFVPDQLVGNGDTRRIGLALVRVTAPTRQEQVAPATA